MRRLGGYTLVLLAAGLWATLGLFYKGLAASGLPPLTIVFFWAGIAALALFLVILWRDRSSLHLTRNDALFFLAFGLVGVAVFYIVYIYAIDWAGMGVAPVWVSLYSILFWGERMEWPQILGAALVLVAVVMLQQGGKGVPPRAAGER